MTWKKCLKIRIILSHNFKYVIILILNIYFINSLFLFSPILDHFLNLLVFCNLWDISYQVAHCLFFPVFLKEIAPTFSGLRDWNTCKRCLKAAVWKWCCFRFQRVKVRPCLFLWNLLIRAWSQKALTSWVSNSCIVGPIEQVHRRLRAKWLISDLALC